ncbi:MAG: ATP-binding protein [Arhodomonas sp.]|nr:ATP-binding protein [Arhodomonas sp.]
MAQVEPLEAKDVFHRYDPSRLPFATTAEVTATETMLGQDRALEALRVGTGVRDNGFNLFVLGPGGVGKHEVAEQFLRRRASDEATPPDWCLVHDFQSGNRPRLIRLPAGQGRRFRKAVEDLVEELKQALPAAFESDEFQRRMRELQQEFGQRQQNAFHEIQEEADQHDIALLQTQNGFTFAPKDENGEVMDPERFRELPEERREAIEKTVEQLQEKLQEVIQQMPRWRKEAQQKIRELHEEMAVFAVGHLLEDLRGDWSEHEDGLGHLDAIRQDVTSNVEVLLGQGGQGRPRPAAGPGTLLSALPGKPTGGQRRATGRRSTTRTCPPTSAWWAASSIRSSKGPWSPIISWSAPGRCTCANGGYLVVDARKLLTQPLAWESLKRALFSRQVTHETPEQYFSLISTVYAGARAHAPGCQGRCCSASASSTICSPPMTRTSRSCSRSQADFEEDLPRTEETTRDYANLVAALAQQRSLRPLDREAVARVIEHASRLADDRERLSVHNRAISDLLTEADHWAGEADPESSRRRRPACRRSAGLSGLPDSRAHRPGHPARDPAYRHRGQRGRAGQRAVGDATRGSVLRSAQTGSRPPPASAAATWWTSSARPSSAAASTPRGDDPIQSPRRPIRPATLHYRWPPASPSSSPTAWSTATAHRWPSTAPCARCYPIFPSPRHRRDRFGEPARTGTGRRGCQRKDRGLLRGLPPAWPQWAPGSRPAAFQRDQSHAPPGCGSGRGGGGVPYLAAGSRG